MPEPRWLPRHWARILPNSVSVVEPETRAIGRGAWRIRSSSGPGPRPCGKPPWHEDTHRALLRERQPGRSDTLPGIRELPQEPVSTLWLGACGRNSSLLIGNKVSTSDSYFPRNSG